MSIEQIGVVAGFEMRKFRAGRKWFFPLLLAAAPVSLVSLLLLFDPHPPSNSDITRVFAVMFQTFMLRLMILFGCALVFANLYRGDMVTRTIHFYLLTPVRREVLCVASGRIPDGAMARRQRESFRRSRRWRC